MKTLKLDKKKFRIRNHLKKVAKNNRFRLSIFRSSKNFSAQIIDDKNSDKDMIHLAKNELNQLPKQKGDYEKTKSFHVKNFSFFGAPVGLIFTIEKDLGWMSWLDYGMFLQNICLAARGQDLHTCPQASWGSYHEVVEKVLGLPAHELVHVGMSLGYEDIDAPQNSLKTVREPLKHFAAFHET